MAPTKTGAAGLTAAAGPRLELGLLDEITLQLVPVLLSGGVPVFEHFAAPILLDGPTLVVEGHRVTHLRYAVRHA